MENASPALSADAELLLNTFQTFNAPVAFTPLWNTLKLRAGHPKEARAKELLLEMVKAGLVRRAGTGKRLFYWLPALEPQAQERICAALNDSPRSKAELEKNFWPSLLPNWPKTQREALLKQLVQTGRVYQWPPLRGNTKLFSVQRPQPELYLQKPVNELADKLQRLAQQLAGFGITTEQVYELAQQLLEQSLPNSAIVVEKPSAPKTPAPDPVELDPAEPDPVEPDPVVVAPNHEDLILNGMRQFSGSPLVSLTELRRSLASALPDKTTFDQAVLALARQGQITLHQHDYPAGLSQAERAELVNDEHGNYFIGIAFND